ncbi:hypothetical protein C9I57_04825 [Trinickia symbiotica]|uniref:Uncharacterized protein n=1 Tax=Trinickia symbiotica TaxID=863227 RepID=A0A2T3XZN7_9BURK|nr:hypothetical protein [Trinickia symbiotica]PTB21951.1 hypothetical protein C9I57_04825 [Trinickia symbiotica]
MPKTHPPAPRPIESSDDRLDEALGETFPASDPIAVDAAEPKGERKHAKTAQADGSAKDKKSKAKRPPPPAR